MNNHSEIHNVSTGTSVHLPGHEGLTLERGEGAQTGDEAKPAYFDQRDAVEEDAVGQDEGDVGPAHTGPHRQQPVHQVHQRPVLWERHEGSPHEQASPQQTGV